MRLKFTVSGSDDGKRIVDILRNTYGMSGSMAKRIRLEGRLLLNGKFSRMIDPAAAGDSITAEYGDNDLLPVKIPERSQVKVLYSDEYLAVMSKPAGMVTHPVSNYRDGTLTDTYKEYSLHPVSRLDRETSGLLILARDPHSHHVLSCQHKKNIIQKYYIGICHGIFSQITGEICAPIRRKENTRMLRHVHPYGSLAKTGYEVIESFRNAGVSVVKFNLLTGKTHQIRVHSLYSGHPIIGDGLYGPSSNENAHFQKSSFFDTIIQRQALHSFRIRFSHPITQKIIDLSDDLPQDMQILLKEIKKVH